MTFNRAGTITRRCISFVFAVAVVGIPLLLSGCGKPSDGRVTVKGTIMLDGQPLTHSGEGQSIINLATKENSNTTTARFNKADGTFEIVIQPGEYIASVTATDGFDEDDEKRGRTIPAKSLVPKKYNSLDTSDATVVIPASGGEVTVQLKSE